MQIVTQLPFPYILPFTNLVQWSVAFSAFTVAGAVLAFH